MRTLILAATILGLSFTGMTVHAQNFDDANIQAGVTKMSEVLKTGGSEAVLTEQTQCYKQATSNKDKKALEYCLAYDIAAFNVLSNLADESGKPMDEPYEMDIYTERVFTGLRALGAAPERIRSAFSALEVKIEAVLATIYGPGGSNPAGSAKPAPQV